MLKMLPATGGAAICGNWGYTGRKCWSDNLIVEPFFKEKESDGYAMNIQRKWPGSYLPTNGIFRTRTSYDSLWATKVLHKRISPETY